MQDQLKKEIEELEKEKTKIDTASAKVSPVKEVASSLSEQFTKINSDVLEPIMDIIKDMGGNEGKYGLGTDDLETQIKNSVEGSKKISEALDNLDAKLTERKTKVELEIQEKTDQLYGRASMPTKLSTGCSSSYKGSSTNTRNRGTL